MLLLDMLLILSELGNRPHESMSFNVIRIVHSALQHWCKAMHSASVEINAISACSLLDQCIGTPANTMMNPARDNHESC
jgi:recombinational DNA repair protein RecR